MPQNTLTSEKSQSCCWISCGRSTSEKSQSCCWISCGRSCSQMRVIHLKLTSSTCMYIIRVRKFYSTSDLHIQLLCTALLLLTSWTILCSRVRSLRSSVQDTLDRHFRYTKLQTPTSSSILWTALTRSPYPILTLAVGQVFGACTHDTCLTVVEPVSDDLAPYVRRK